MLLVTGSFIFINKAVFPEILRSISLTKLIRYAQNDYFYLKLEKSLKMSIKNLINFNKIENNNNKLSSVQ